MRITHRPASGASWWAVPESDPVPPEYEAQVQLTTQRAEREYRNALRRFERAEAKLAAAQQLRERNRKAVKLKQLKELEALVEIRREELADWHRMMVATSASAEHRGPKSYRPVPKPGIPL